MNVRTKIAAGLCLTGLLWIGCTAARQKAPRTSGAGGSAADLDLELSRGLAASCEDLVIAEVQRLASEPRPPG